MSVIAETEIVKVIADLIAQEMDLESDRVFLYNQDAALSTDTGIYVCLLYTSRCV